MMANIKSSFSSCKEDCLLKKSRILSLKNCFRTIVKTNVVTNKIHTLNVLQSKNGREVYPASYP